MQVGYIILAAGQSSRLGEPKQLLSYGGESLVQRAARICNEVSSDAPIIVVSGAHHVEVKREVSSRAKVVYNSEYAKGMSTSIACGIQELRGQVSGAVVVLCDQLYLSKEILSDLVEKGQGRQESIVLSNYGSASGPPSYFGSHYFDELAALTGDEGAKPVVKKYKEVVKYIAFPKGDIDVDYPSDKKYLAP